MNPDLAATRKELDRLLYRRGDLQTLRDDAEARIVAIDAEADAVKGAIASTRSRIAELEQAAKQQPPQLVPQGLTEMQQAQMGLAAAKKQ